MDGNVSKFWPADLTPTIQYIDGIKPMHRYLQDYAQKNPDKIAIIWYGREITYGELNALSDEFAAFLTTLGVKKGDRVALFLSNCPQYFIAHFGIQKLGAIVGPCSPAIKEWELEYQLSDLGAQVIVAADSLYDIVAKVLPQSSLQHVILTGYGDFLPEQPTLNVPEELKRPTQMITGTYDLLTVIRDMQATPAPVTVGMDDTALMVYTSGTTGKPKGAILSYMNALFKAAAGAQSNGVKASDIILSVAPLYHIAGMLMGLNTTIYANATTVLFYKFAPEATLQAIHRYKCTWWYSIAPMNVAIMQVPNAAAYDLSSLKINLGTSFGITLTKELSEAWFKFTGGCKLYEAAYGLSETHTGDTFMPASAVK